MSTPVIEILGIHKVESNQPCYLVEIIVKTSNGKFDLLEFTQEIEGVSQMNWQVPYYEKFLSSDGNKIIGDVMLDEDKEDLWSGDVRIAFFFHYLDINNPLRTPFGDVELPSPTPKPDRLNFMEYEEID